MTPPTFAACLRDQIMRIGEFTLSNGSVSHLYWDKYLAVLEPRMLRTITRKLVALLPPPESYDLLAGLELGAVPLLTSLSQSTDVPGLIVRKAPHATGTQFQIEGAYHEGQRVVLVEDVITSGQSVLRGIQALGVVDLTTVMVIGMIDREQGGPQAILEAGYPVACLIRQSELLVGMEAVWQGKQ